MRRMARIGYSLDEIVADELAKATRDRSGCWIADCCISAQGYPVVTHQRKRLTLTRLVLEKKIGRDLAVGEVTRHRCDVRPCINPDHLMVGTDADNVRDMDERGRRVTVPSRGADHGCAVLTESDVLEIRDRRQAGATLRELADRFSVTVSTISLICLRKTWAHI